MRQERRLSASTPMDTRVEGTSSNRRSAERQPRALRLLHLLRIPLIQSVPLGQPVLRSRTVRLAVVDKGVLRPRVANVLPVMTISTRDHVTETSFRLKTYQWV